MDFYLYASYDTKAGFTSVRQRTARHYVLAVPRTMRLLDRTQSPRHERRTFPPPMKILCGALRRGRDAPARTALRTMTALIQRMPRRLPHRRNAGLAQDERELWVRRLFRRPTRSEWAKPGRVLSPAEWFCFVKAAQSRGGETSLLCAVAHGRSADSLPLLS